MFAAVKCAAAPKPWTGYSADYEAAGGTRAFWNFSSRLLVRWLRGIPRR
jgi:hypothetical protein